MSVYDNFAKQYSQSMGDNGDEIHQTIIDPSIYSIIGDINNKTIYDIGCGNGYMANYFACRGATVYASDISQKLIEEAKSKYKKPSIHFACHDGLDFTLYKNSQFDAVVMNMVIHYIKDLDALFIGISRVLKDNGIYVFSTNHFFRPNYPYSEWIEGNLNNKKRLFIKTTGYLRKEEREITSGWDNKTKMKIYNHPLNEFVNTLSKNSLYLFRVDETGAAGFAHNFSEELRKSHNIPTFIIMGAKKFKR